MGIIILRWENDNRCTYLDVDVEESEGRVVVYIYFLSVWSLQDIGK
jgi:hypothetical protein